MAKRQSVRLTKFTGTVTRKPNGQIVIKGKVPKTKVNRSRKNVEAGFYDESGFHPFRGSKDYDEDRAGDNYTSRTARGGLKFTRQSPSGTGKYAKKKTPKKRKR